eukprot:scaffold266_cov391-Prasinococcus_capsulatus_cf.AAC.19
MLVNYAAEERRVLLYVPCIRSGPPDRFVCVPAASCFKWCVSGLTASATSAEVCSRRTRSRAASQRPRILADPAPRGATGRRHLVAPAYGGAGRIRLLRQRSRYL